MHRKSKRTQPRQMELTMPAHHAWQRLPERQRSRSRRLLIQMLLAVLQSETEGGDGSD